MERWQSSLLPSGDRSALPAQASCLDRHAEKVLGFPTSIGNRIELLHGCDAIFDALVDEIDRARSKIHMSFYIWHEGGRSDDVVDALIRAAGRGVECKALADAMGSKTFLAGRQVERLREAGVDLVAALPTGPLRTLFVRADLRNHRKIVEIDDQVAFTGSQNLVDPRFFKQESGVGQWVDAMVRISGPCASSLGGVFELDWVVETGRHFEPPGYSTAETVPSSSPGAAIQVIPSGPDLHPEAIHQLLLTAIYGARKELVMTTPYFVPEESMITALISAALRGVDVTLIVPANNDSVMVRYASAAHYDDLISAGVRIALFNGGLLHTKSLAIDGETSIFGSVNLDIRSLWLNFEISLFVYDPGFTARLRSLQDSYIADSDQLELHTWRQRSPWRRFIENAVRLVGPLL
jgi:cardiolipin synthase